MFLTFYGGGLPHFVNHLAPIYKAFPTSHRGSFHARGRGAQRAKELGIHPFPGAPRNAEAVIVASYEDLRAIKSKPRKILLNHGVGQTYNGDPDSEAFNHPSYSGGKGREQVDLFLCPSVRDARNCGPNSVVIGVPYLDRYAPFHFPVNEVTGRAKVAISFHCDIHLCPETRWAFPHFRDTLIELARANLPYDIIGHSHPRIRPLLQPFWERLNIPFYKEWDQVLEEANLYVCDNSSTMFEFAFTGRPVVVMNAPWYRRDVHHGGRFWKWADVGYQVDDPRRLGETIQLTLDIQGSSSPNWSRRESIVADAYDGVKRDGKATERAVEALMEFLEVECHPSRT